MAGNTDRLSVPTPKTVVSIEPASAPPVPLTVRSSASYSGWRLYSSAKRWVTWTE